MGSHSFENIGGGGGGGGKQQRTYVWNRGLDMAVEQIINFN